MAGILSSLKRKIKTITFKKIPVEIPTVYGNLLDGRVALITGGTTGIGFEIAKAFIHNGASVIITGRNEERINSAVSQLKKEIKEKIEQLSKELNIKNLLDCSTKYLSASEKQIIALTKALINNSKVLILDDSMLLMDNKQRDLVFKYLKKINTKNKITIINLTSNVEDSIYGKQIAILNNGEIMTKDKKEKVLEKEKDFKQANLNLPFIADLSIKLGYYGLLNKIVLDKNKMVDILWK